MRFILPFFSAFIPCLAIGCTHPSEDNIRLRKINQGLQNELSALKIKSEADQRMIAGLLQRSPTVSVLPAEELKKLWVPTGVQFGRLTGISDLDFGKPGVQGLRVYVNTVDENGTAIQAAGSFVVEAFDLAEPKDNFLGRWTWDPLAAKTQWRSFMFEFGYELNCPWQKMPKHPDITIRVVFTDELTHIPYTGSTVIHSGPASLPATIPGDASAR